MGVKQVHGQDRVAEVHGRDDLGKSSRNSEGICRDGTVRPILGWAKGDLVGGLEAVKRKQELQVEIERQIELGGGGLDEQDKYLLEIDLEDME